MITNFKRSLFTLGLVIFWLMPQYFQVQAQTQWKLLWEENFNGTKIDRETWSRIPRGKPDWQNTMSLNKDLVELRNGKLVLHGKINEDTSVDPSTYISGGLWTKDKKGFMGGRLEVRAKLQAGKGAWPAIWLMPFEMKKDWPLEGEIDLMERLNYDNYVHQTVHSNYTWNLKHKIGSTKTTGINPDEFNTYGVEMQRDKLSFFVNGKKTFEYWRDPKKEKDGQFPFYRKFHLILSMQLDGAWVGPVRLSDLPLEMEIDWVRHYQKVDLAKIDYPHWDEIEHPRAGSDRVVQALSLSGANFKKKPQSFETIVAGKSATKQSQIYFDNTSDVLKLTRGDKITLTPQVAQMKWMHYYLFIDWNQNKKFEDDEIVSYSAKKGEDGKWYDSLNNKVEFGSIPEKMPVFIVPKTAKLGLTRARFKVDWDNSSALGNTDPKNLLSDNRGTVVDFSIQVSSDKGENTGSETTAVQRVASDDMPVQIYPNPCRLGFSLKGVKGLTSLQIYSLDASLVKEFKHEQAWYELGDLSKGTYLLLIKTSDKQITRKLIVF